MNNISIIKDCSNCGACVCSCPVGAIAVGEENCFYKPSVDSEKCISCGKCISVCPVNNQREGYKPIKAVGGWTKEAEERKESSSGGAFTLLANYVLSQNGVVFGAKFTDDCRKVVFDSTDRVSLDELRRSKYVESLTGNSFSEVLDNLKKGRQVLFCGTPCQVAGLKSFLGEDYENLILCDFACGGLPSHKIYGDYLEKLEKKYKSKAVSVNFRPKTFGWSVYSVLVEFSNKKKYSRMGIIDPYLYSFAFGRLSIRENCYDCKFSDNHFSDITIADYWKYKDTPKIVNDEKGISLITANTKKGLSMIENIKDGMQCYELLLEKASYNYKETVHSDSLMKKREKFFSAVESGGLSEAAKACGMPSGVKARIISAKTKFRYLLSGNKNG